MSTTSCSYGSCTSPSTSLSDDFGARHGQFVAFAAHGLDQHRQMQFATARNLEFVRVLGFLDTQCDIVQNFAHQPIADLAAGHEPAFLAAERRIVHLERHADGGLVHGHDRQTFGGIDRADRIGNAQALDAGNRDDVAGFGFGHFAAFQAHEAEHLQHATLALLAFAVDDRHRHVGAHLAAFDAADTDQADVGVVIELADAHLERTVRIDLRRVHMLHDRFVQRGHVARPHVLVQAGVAVQGRGVDHREIELFVGRAETVEQIERLVQHPVRARARAVDLVDHHDRLEAHLERLLGDEARLRHRAVHRIDQQQHRIDHRQHALDFAAEVGMSGRVDDIDAVVAPGDRRVLGQNRDAAFLFLVVGIHHALGEHGAFAERAGLLEQTIDEGGLAMVDVGDNGDVAEFFDGHGDGPAARQAESKGKPIIIP